MLLAVKHIVNCFKDVDSVWHPGPHLSQNNKPGTTGSTDNYVWKGVEMKRQQLGFQVRLQVEQIMNKYLSGLCQDPLGLLSVWC